MQKGIGEQELTVLKTIAETLNRTNDLERMLQSVLAELLRVTGLEAGWLFLVEERPHYRFMANENLPPALSWNNNQPMCKGTCYCLDEFWAGELEQPVNIIECKRLDDAMKYEWGDTKGISHHATIPLTAGMDYLGILNVASPGKTHFTQAELNLLQLVAFQIGTAIKRTNLYLYEKERAENFSKLDEVIRFVWDAADERDLPIKIVEKCYQLFQWPVIAFFTIEGGEIRLYGDCEQISSHNDNDLYKACKEQKVMINKAARKQLRSLGLPEEKASIVVPLKQSNGGILVAGSRGLIRSDHLAEVLKALAEYISLALERMQLNKQREELVVYEERNRLARDLHDSVNQKLFSLSLMSRGLKELTIKDDVATIDALNSIEQLSQEALTEMKSLIWQLRPAAIEKGLVVGLKQYGQSLGLTVREAVTGVYHLPQKIEEALWRIGQEALNNVYKHAKTKQVSLKLHTNASGIAFIISDSGKGFCFDEKRSMYRSFGLTSMQERAELAGGICKINSKCGTGTEINVYIPRKSDSG